MPSGSHRVYPARVYPGFHGMKWPAVHRYPPGWDATL